MKQAKQAKPAKIRGAGRAAKVRAAARAGKVATRVAPRSSSNAKNYRLRIAEGLLIVEKLDGTPVVKILKSEREESDAAVALASSAAPGDASNAKNYRLRIVDGELLVEKLDGTLAVKVPKGQWQHVDGATCVRCVNKQKPRGTPDFIPCC